MAAALGDAEVCHLDASKGMVQWARDNAVLNGLKDHPIRWITDDAHKFMERENRRGRRYDAVVFDPPTFGRGANGEMYKIERDLKKTISLVKGILSDNPLFVLFSSHTPGLSCIVAANIMRQAFPDAKIETGEMLLEGRSHPCPSGIYCRVVFPRAIGPPFALFNVRQYSAPYDSPVPEMPGTLCSAGRWFAAGSQYNLQAI